MVYGPPITRQGSDAVVNGQPAVPNPLAKLIGNPFLLNLLAQQGHSLTPGPSPLGVIGRAGLATAEQQQGLSLQKLQEELLKATIGLRNAQASGGVNPTAGNVQTTFEGENGNMWIVTRGGQTKDTGVKFSNNLQLVERPDGSVIAVDRRSGQPVGTPVTPEEASIATTRAAQTKAATTLPTDLAGMDALLNKADATIVKIDEVLPLVKPSTTGVRQAVRGDLPGFLGGEARELKRAAKSLQAEFGFDTLSRMRAASKTGGALGQVSERELDLLINALRAIDLEGDDEVLRENLFAVKTHYENYKRELEVMKNAMRQQAGQTVDPIAEPDEFEGFSIATD